MAIYIKRVYTDSNLLKDRRDAYHEALVGTPGYLNSEIAIVEEDENSFTLCVGNSNDNDIHITIDTNNQKVE